MAALLLALLLSPAVSFTLMPQNRVVRAPRTSIRMNLLDDFLGKPKGFAEPCVMGEESLMDQKEHGTSMTPVQSNLRWSCDVETADRICNFNRCVKRA